MKDYTWRIEDMDDIAEDLKKLRIENDLLRKENTELKEQLQKVGAFREILNLDDGATRKKTSIGHEKQIDTESREKTKEDVNPREKITTNCTGVAERCIAPTADDLKHCASSTMHSLSADAIRRYSRQLLVPAFGVAGQELLLKSAILVIGCGGLGSPIALYLAAAGVGCLGLVDHDVVEVSNLHRQVIHTENYVGESKVKSAASACRRLNSSVRVIEYCDGLSSANAIEIVSKFDVVVDATDNLPSRYLINDACVATKKPLVSGAALGAEGQVTVYNESNGPCYRCLFPVPPPEGARQRCSDNGVIGVVPGIIGTFQALEALKLAAGFGETLSRRMVLLDALATRIRVINLRPRNPSCVACGDSPQITSSNLQEYDYTAFTQSQLSDEAPQRQHLIPESDRISVEELKRRLDSGDPHLLLDVRDAHEYAISALSNSVNIPYSSLRGNLQMLEEAVTRTGQSIRDDDNSALSFQSLENDLFSCDSRSSRSVPHGETITTSSSLYESTPIYVVCRRGNDSQRAVRCLRNEGFSNAIDVIGGLESWATSIDKKFPFY